MRVLLSFLFFFVLGVNTVNAYELVLPKEKKSIVNTNYAFFVGKASKAESITINDEKIYIAPNGAFAHSVKLKEGENRVVMKSNYNTQVYRFYKDKKNIIVKPQLIEFEPRVYKIKNDNTPLRSTPVDYGMNRISHLFEDTNILVDGEKGDFYRVKLAQDKLAWVSKSAVCLSDNIVEPPKFVSMNSESYKNATVHSIQFTDRLPYAIEETDKEIIFKVYNSFVAEGSIYTINILKPEKYSYKTSLKNGEYSFKVNELPIVENDSLEGMTIVVDAGHGGSEKGALGCLGDKEKDINLAIALELKNILSLNGANVVMTRECDGSVSLDDRVNIARENSSNIFISIHLNSIPDIKMDIHKHRGTSVYYYNENSKDLAKILEENVSKAIGTRKDGVKSASFAVLRPTDYIGVLLEVAYMTNPIDSMIYKKDSFPLDVAQAIVAGLQEFIDLKE